MCPSRPPSRGSVKSIGAEQSVVNRGNFHIPRGCYDLADAGLAVIEERTLVLACSAQAIRPRVPEASPEALEAFLNRERLWKSFEDTAWLQIDLGASSELRCVVIHWWGKSWAEQIFVEVSEDAKKWETYLTHADLHHDERSFDRKTILRDFDSDIGKPRVRFVRLRLLDGNLDEWYRRYKFGIRTLAIYGRIAAAARDGAGLMVPSRRLSPKPAHTRSRRAHSADGRQSGCYYRASGFPTTEMFIAKFGATARPQRGRSCWDSCRTDMRGLNMDRRFGRARGLREKERRDHLIRQGLSKEQYDEMVLGARESHFNTLEAHDGLPSFRGFPLPLPVSRPQARVEWPARRLPPPVPGANRTEEEDGCSSLAWSRPSSAATFASRRRVSGGGRPASAAGRSYSKRPTTATTRPSTASTRPATATTRPGTADPGSAQGSQQPAGKPGPLEDELPRGWFVFAGDDGTPYYYNTLTKVAQWEKPRAPQPPAGWIVCKSEEGRPYYYHLESQQATWEFPTTQEGSGAREGLQTHDEIWEWEPRVADDGRTFYYNSSTGEAVWDAPTACQDVAADAILPEGWERVEDPQNGVYYWNAATQESTWEIPGPQPDLDRIASSQPPLTQLVRDSQKRYEFVG